MASAPAWVLREVSKLARRAADSAASGATVSGEPIVEASVEGDRVTFVFDFMLLFSNQSGSDSYEHHVFTGTARIAGEQLHDVSTVERLNRPLSEHQVEWADTKYDRRAAIRAIR